MRESGEAETKREMGAESGTGEAKKNIQVFSLGPRPFFTLVLFSRVPDFGISSAVGRFCPRYIRRFQNWPGSMPVTRGTRRGSGQNSVGNLQCSLSRVGIGGLEERRNRLPYDSGSSFRLTPRDS